VTVVVIGAHQKGEQRIILQLRHHDVAVVAILNTIWKVHLRINNCGSFKDAFNGCNSSLACGEQGVFGFFQLKIMPSLDCVGKNLYGIRCLVNQVSNEKHRVCAFANSSIQHPHARA
jgi:hypothetical protein